MSQDEPLTDLYGYQLNAGCLADQAVRLQCDGAAMRAERYALQAVAQPARAFRVPWHQRCTLGI